MKHSLKTSLLLTTIFLISCQSLTSLKSSNKEESAANDPAKTVVSTYSGGQITLKDAELELKKLIAKDNKLKDLTFDKLDEDQKEAIIKEAAFSEIAMNEAKKRKLNKDKDYQEALKVFEAELLKQKLLVAITKEATEEDKLKKNYDELVLKLKDKKDIRVSYIVVKTKKEAETIYESLIKSPSGFSDIAKKKSLDKEVAKKGGDLGFVLEDSISTEVVKQARSVNKGQIAKPILTSGKWVIIKFVDERPAEIMPFEKAKDAIAQNLAKKAIEDFVSQSIEKANISILIK